ncbi:MAG: hypothetical protein QOF67_775 [Mycobacterium sp.]|jgi:site-specific recombinase XerD|nr:hypothetical protein [Mycobacterium sp.]
MADELRSFLGFSNSTSSTNSTQRSKRWLTALRASIAFKIAYAYGLRRQELVMLDLTDFGPDPHAPSYQITER